MAAKKKDNKNVTHVTKSVPKKKVGRPKIIKDAVSTLKKPVGRPQKEIDYIMVKELAGQGCTIEEIAGYLGLSHDTLTRRDEFMPIYQEGLNKMRRSLRRKQYEAAMEGNITMQIWLGKQMLGQSDKRETEMTVQGGEKPIKIMPVQERIKAYEHLFKEEIST